MMEHDSTVVVDTSARPASPGPVYRSASYPFNKASADVVLRSSDGVDFRVRSAILTEVSPFFEDMFGLPQSDADPSRLDPIPMEEDSRILQILLQLCYPLVDRVPEDLTLSDARALLEAAIKYDMDTAKELMRRSLKDFAKTEPLRVYAIACIHRLEHEARCAAEKVVNQKVGLGDYVEELKEISAGCYHRLLQFQNQDPSNAMSGANFTFTSGPADPHPRSDVEHELSEQPWSDAPSPFDRPDADVIVVSQDRVRFRVHSSVLSIASPVFASMLTTKESRLDCIYERGAKVQDPAHLVLSEPSAILQTIFEFCYPMGPHRTGLEDYAACRSLMSVALKYSLRHIIQTLKANLLHYVASSPFQTYTLAVLYGWNDEAERAAESTLYLDLQQLQTIYDPTLEHINADSYRRLFQFHKKCGLAASAVAEDYKTVIRPKAEQWTQFRCDSCSKSSIASRRLSNYMTTARTLLQHKPHTSTLSEGAALTDFTTMSASGCDKCRTKRIEKANSFNRAFKAAITTSVSKVKYTFC